MRSGNVRYPVDRYLVECSKNFEIVNIIGDDLWNTEPALKPEDEIILRKLHEMLQSTADDLKLLSGELSKYREPGVQVMSTPTPLDEEFNEKVHIEEIVNAKFHGYKVIDKPPLSLLNSSKSNANKNNIINPQKLIENVQVTKSNSEPRSKKSNKKNLGLSQTKLIQINGTPNKVVTLNNGKVVNAPTVAYNEFTYEYVEPKIKQPLKVLQVQKMPSINIRSELKEQKVLNIDIQPDSTKLTKEDTTCHNVAVVSLTHEALNEPVQRPSGNQVPLNNPQLKYVSKTTRKISKLSTCESSESNNVSSDTQVKLKTQKSLLSTIKSSPKNSARSDRKKLNSARPADKRSNLYLEDWRKKLNTVYASSNSRKVSSKGRPNQRPDKNKTQPVAKVHSIPIKIKKSTSNAEYIPYSKLTIGGVRASDIENEIAEYPNKNDLPLSPILDKILSSPETSSRKEVLKSQKVFTTSDENLLHEVLDIERTVSDTLSKNTQGILKDPQVQSTSSESNDQRLNESYADDFEDDKSDAQSDTQIRKNKNDDDNNNYSSEDSAKIAYATEKSKSAPADMNIHNKTYTKISNLTVKNKIDVFEFVHSVDTQDTATQSQIDKRISPKETQTSPNSEEVVQPIHNNLWPSLDPRGEVEKLFKLEKDFIKQLIIEEYGDLIETSVAKPSTSKQITNVINMAASQKNTQTSPARVKHVMTSPARTKTRPTSPFPKLTTDHNTSPLIFITTEDNVKIDVEEDELGISVNLSSPRFSLRLPQNTREVLSNLGDSLRSEKKSNVTVAKNKRSDRTTSTTSVEADSSEISSLGEVRFRKKFGKIQIHSDSESISSTSSDLPSGILPLRSEGEMSLRRKQKFTKRNSKSEGEASLGLL